MPWYKSGCTNLPYYLNEWIIKYILVNICTQDIRCGCCLLAKNYINIRHKPTFPHRTHNRSFGFPLCLIEVTNISIPLCACLSLHTHIGIDPNSFFLIFLAYITQKKLREKLSYCAWGKNFAASRASSNVTNFSINIEKLSLSQYFIFRQVYK